MGLGILGARRLMDDFDIRPSAGPARRWSAKKHSAGRAGDRRDTIAQLMAAARGSSGRPTRWRSSSDQNRELCQALDELHERQDELDQLNRELEDTNRGVVALYAELDEKADSCGARTRSSRASCPT